MNDLLTEDLRLLRASVREIARLGVAPRAYQIDQDREYPEDVFQVFRNNGLFDLPYPPEEGGEGLGTLGMAIAVEEVARACATSAQMLILSALTTWPIRLAGSQELRAAYVPAVAAGNRRGAFAWMEPNASSDVGAMVTRAERRHDRYLLYGEKDFVSGSPQADFFIVFAKVDGASGPDGDGMTAFLAQVPQPGVVFLRRDEGMGIKGMPHCDWAFDGCEVPLDRRLGEEGRGTDIARLSMNAIQPLLAARGLGAAEEALAYARDYANKRRIYGGRLADLQAIQLHLADIAVSVEATRLLTYQAAKLVDEGRFREESDAAYLNAAKVLAFRTAVRAADEGMQVVGGHGYMEVHPMERMYRDARHLGLYMGADEVLRLRIAQAVLDGGLGYGPSLSRQPTEERARREKR
jgi:alkylation response protein AidB-like acyl-CoA dehydrogenase